MNNSNNLGQKQSEKKIHYHDILYPKHNGRYVKYNGRNRFYWCLVSKHIYGNHDGGGGDGGGSELIIEACKYYKLYICVQVWIKLVHIFYK